MSVLPLNYAPLCFDGGIGGSCVYIEDFKCGREIASEWKCAVWRQVFAFTCGASLRGASHVMGIQTILSIMAMEEQALVSMGDV